MAGPGEVINETRFPVSQSTACFSLAVIASCRTRVLENLKGQKVQRHIKSRLALSICGPRTFGSELKHTYTRTCTRTHACAHTHAHMHTLSLTPSAALESCEHHFSSCIFYVSDSLSFRSHTPSSQGQKRKNLENHFYRYSHTFSSWIAFGGAGALPFLQMPRGTLAVLFAPFHIMVGLSELRCLGCKICCDSHSRTMGWMRAEARNEPRWRSSRV